MITIQKADITDAETLTAIMKKTFDEETRRWLSNEPIVDYNIQPPDYDSVEVTNYTIEELVHYKTLHNDNLVGGMIVIVKYVLDKCEYWGYTKVNKIIYKKLINSPITKRNCVLCITFCNM